VKDITQTMMEIIICRIDETMIFILTQKVENSNILIGEDSYVY